MLLIGVVAELDGLFRALGGALARVPVGALPQYLLSLALIVLVTAVLNLDTCVFFLTPVLLHLARSRGVDEEPFLYGAVFMSNAGSLFLPGSNLTNLIVLRHEHVPGGTFALRLLPSACASVVVTASVLALAFRGTLARPPAHPAAPARRARIGVATAAVAASVVLVLALADPALPVLAVGVAAIALARPPLARIRAAVDVRVVGGLFALAVAVGTLGRSWHGLDAFVASLGRWQTAFAGAVSSVGLNNLPAAALLGPSAHAHARALLIGLDVGPNLAVTGSLSAFLWLRVARSLGAAPSVRTYTRLGLVAAPLAIAAATAVVWR